jgi:hypothetical protein
MERMTLLAAITHPDFLVVRVDPQFSGKYARVIHRVRDASHPSGRTCVFSGESETILAALKSIERGGQYLAPGEN